MSIDETTSEINAIFASKFLDLLTEYKFRGAVAFIMREDNVAGIFQVTQPGEPQLVYDFFHGLIDGVLMDYSKEPAYHESGFIIKKPDNEMPH